MLVVAVVHLHYVVEGRVEEGKLSKHHCGAERDAVCRSQGEDGAPCSGVGEALVGWGPRIRGRAASMELVGSWGLTAC